MNHGMRSCEVEVGTTYLARTCCEIVMKDGVSRASTSPRCLAKASLRFFLSPLVLRASNVLARAHNMCRDIRSIYSSLRPLRTVLVA